MPDNCKCSPVEKTLMTALAGDPVEPCRMHGTFGYAGHKADQEAGSAPPALNSEALENALAASLGAAVADRGGNHLADNPQF